MLAKQTEQKKTPLQSLMEVNAALYARRPKKAPAYNFTGEVESYYKRQLTYIVQALAKRVLAEVVPIIKEEKSTFYRDSVTNTERYIEVCGLFIYIEQWAGEKRKPEWPPLRNHYGYIRDILGADGDCVDVFLKGTIVSEKLPVFIVDQIHEDGSFDEHKVMLGFASRDEARKAYLSNFTADWKCGPIAQLTLEVFKQWLTTNTSKPISKKFKDSAIMDGYAERIVSALARLLSDFETGVFSEQAERLAAGTVSMAESASTRAFVKSINKAVGVDVTHMLSQEGLTDYIEAAVKENAGLIKTIPRKYLSEVEQIMLSGTRAGYAPSAILKQLQRKYDISKNNAQRIAVDQTLKLNSDITRIRQKNAGIAYYRAVDSNDIAVAGRPGGKYPNAKIKCWEIARRDIGYGPGVYRVDTGASYGGETGLFPGRQHVRCRCTMSPVFEWELPERKRS
jgi:hypothetical protein